MKRRLLVDVTTKSGNTFNNGIEMDLSFPQESDGRVCIATDSDGRRFRIRISSLKDKFGIRVPSMKTLEKWVDDGTCSSIGGKSVEPDGWDSNGTPSWLIALGLI